MYKGDTSTHAQATEIRKHSPTTGARTNNTIHVTRPPDTHRQYKHNTRGEPDAIDIGLIPEEYDVHTLITTQSDTRVFTITKKKVLTLAHARQTIHYTSN